ncbi:MAG: hypothetical protein Fur0032_22710 [Terrimicrobiaceae bacterium]
MANSNNQLRAAGGILSRLGATVFFLIFGAIGLFFLVVAARPILGTMETCSWKSVPAEILSAKVVEEPDRERPYVVQVRFRYSWEGAVYESGRFQIGTEGHSEYSAAAEKLQGLSPGSWTTCLVNPQNPSGAVLRHGSWWIILILLIPVVFVLVGFGGIYGVWARGRNEKNRSQPIGSQKKGHRTGRAFALVFVAVGLVGLFAWYLPSLARSLASLQWAETPCHVVSSRVVEVDSDDGTTYRVDILYRYSFGGREYQSSRYKSFQGSSSGRAAKQAVVDRHPPGSQTVCYVDPSAPGHAVLVRGVGWEAALGVVPLMFIVFGLIFFFYAGARPQTAMVTAPRGIGPGDCAPRELKSRMTPWSRLLLTLFGCLFWNGIVSVFLFQVVEEWQQGQSPWFLTVFLIPFVLVGAGLLAAAGYALLALANPRVRVSVSPGIWTAGGECEVTWSLSGATSRLTRLQIHVEGREEATYRRGTSSTTDRHVFARLGLADVSTVLEMAQGQARRKLPAGLPPGFHSENNKIVWSVKVRGQIPFWPDLDEEFEIAVAGGGNQ